MSTAKSKKNKRSSAGKNIGLTEDDSENIDSNNSLLNCEKEIKVVSPFQILNYAMIRDKGFGMRFDNLKTSIKENGFLELSKIWGVLCNEKDGDRDKRIESCTSELSDDRKKIIDASQDIILLIDGAQRTEAICQLIENGTFPKDFKVEVCVPKSKGNTDFSFCKIVSAAHALNYITRSNVPVSFWDKIKGYEKIKSATNSDYPGLLEYGFSGKKAETIYFLNVQHGNSNFFRALKKSYKSAEQKKNVPAIYNTYKDIWYHHSEEHEIQALLFNCSLEFGIRIYMKEHDLCDRVTSDALRASIYSPFSKINSGGWIDADNDDVYSVFLLAFDCREDLEKLIQEGNLNMQHDIFGKFAFEALVYKCTNENERFFFILRLFYIALHSRSSKEISSKTAFVPPPRKKSKKMPKTVNNTESGDLILVDEEGDKSNVEEMSQVGFLEGLTKYSWLWFDAQLELLRTGLSQLEKVLKHYHVDNFNGLDQDLQKILATVLITDKYLIDVKFCQQKEGKYYLPVVKEFLRDSAKVEDDIRKRTESTKKKRKRKRNSSAKNSTSAENKTAAVKPKRGPPRNRKSTGDVSGEDDVGDEDSEDISDGAGDNTTDVSDGAGDSTAECLDKKVKFSKDDETTKKGGNKATPLAVIATKSSFKSKNVVPNLIFKIHNFSLELRTSLESIRTFYDKV